MTEIIRPSHFPLGNKNNSESKNIFILSWEVQQWLCKMPRIRVTDESRQPILRDSQADGGEFIDNELEEAGGCCNPAKPMYRFIALIFMCLVGFGT